MILYSHKFVAAINNKQSSLHGELSRIWCPNTRIIPDEPIVIVAVFFATLFVSDMDYSLILLSNNASMDAEQPFLPIYKSKQN
jgi:hypothetical protein